MLAAATGALIADYSDDAGLLVSLGGEEIDEKLSALNAPIAKTPGVMMRQGPWFFRAIRAAGGVVIVLYDCDTPCGYSVLVPSGPDMPPFQQSVDKTVGLLFGTVVLESHRRQGWQRGLVAIRTKAFAACGVQTCQAVVAPGNEWSLRNLLAEGFEVVGYDDKRAGAPRFVVERIGAAEPISSADIVEALPPLADRALHVRQLLAGRRGTALMVDDQLYIGYHSRNPSPFE